MGLFRKKEKKKDEAVELIRKRLLGINQLNNENVDMLKVQKDILKGADTYNQVKNPNSMSILNVTWSEFEGLCHILATKILPNLSKYDGLYGIPRGGINVAIMLSHDLKVLPLVDKVTKKTLVVDDIIHTGKTVSKFKKNDIACLHFNSRSIVRPKYYVQQVDKWVHYPYEIKTDGAIRVPETIHDNITRILEYINADMTDEGIIDTPKRVVRMFSELYSGYHQDPKDILLPLFKEQCDEMVIVKDIEVFSTCKHHMLPFFGKCHIGYIPTNNMVIGASKLPRLVNCFARRLQTQETLANQIADAIMKYVKPLGCGVIIECHHMCMMSRGIKSNNSKLVTSALRGIFKKEDKKNPASKYTRAEFLKLLA